MTRPHRLDRERITQGETFVGVYTILNPDKTPMDLSTKDTLFRFTPQASVVGGVEIDRFSGNPGETGFPVAETGVEGNIFPVIDHPATLVMAAGFYDLTVWVEDEAATPDDRTPAAEGLIEVVAAKGGEPTPLDA